MKTLCLITVGNIQQGHQKEETTLNPSSLKRPFVSRYNPSKKKEVLERSLLASYTPLNVSLMSRLPVKRLSQHIYSA